MRYFVMSEGNWSLSLHDLMHALRSRWPSVKVREQQATESTDCLDFEVPLVHSEVSGSLSRSGKYVALEGDIRDCALLALWIRSLAPADAPLMFCDEGMSGSAELRPETSEQELFRAFDYHPPPPGWMDYSLIARGGWSLDSRTFTQLLRTHWPSAIVTESEAPDSPWTVEFQVPMARSQLKGTVRRRVAAIAFTGDIHDCAEFALWCRSVLPAAELLLTCERGHLQIEAGTSVAEITQRFAAPRS